MQISFPPPKSMDENYMYPHIKDKELGVLFGSLWDSIISHTIFLTCEDYFFSGPHTLLRNTTFLKRILSLTNLHIDLINTVNTISGYSKIKTWTFDSGYTFLRDCWTASCNSILWAKFDYKNTFLLWYHIGLLLIYFYKSMMILILFAIKVATLKSTCYITNIFHRMVDSPNAKHQVSPVLPAPGSVFIQMGLDRLIGNGD